MSDLKRLRSLLSASGDPDNPPAESLAALLPTMKRLAVVGASRDPLKPARRIPSYLAAKGLEVIPVNPNASWILGRPSRPSLTEVPEEVDLVLFFRPSDEVGELMDQARTRTERPVLWLPEGVRDDAAAGRARAGGRLVVQDLCLFKAHRCLEENRPEPIVPRERLVVPAGHPGQDSPSQHMSQKRSS